MTMVPNLLSGCSSDMSKPQPQCNAVHLHTGQAAITDLCNISCTNAMPVISCYDKQILLDRRAWST